VRQLGELLAESSVFRKLDIESQKELKDIAVSRVVEKGEIIVHHGEILDCIIMIADGIVEALKTSEEGRSFAVKSYVEGDVIWGHAIFDGGGTPATLRAKGSCVIYQWPAQALMPIIKKSNEALWDLSVMLHEKIRMVSQTVEELAFSPTANRLARLLLDNFDTEKQTLSNRIMTLDEMAARIGTTREVVCRLLYRFSDAKLIDVTRTQIAILNKDKLTLLAEDKIRFSPKGLIEL